MTYEGACTDPFFMRAQQEDDLNGRRDRVQINQINLSFSKYMQIVLLKTGGERLNPWF